MRMTSKYITRILTLCLTTFTVCAATAQTVMWSIPPKYDSIEEYTADAYLCSADGKCGVVASSGEVIVPIEVDDITESYEGKALALVKDSDSRWRIVGILHVHDMKYSPLSERYYMNKYSHFSEGLLSVMNQQGAAGYIDDEGNVVIDCQFASACPFSQGLALVVRPSSKQECLYIKRDYGKTRMPLIVDFANGRLTAGTTFKNGRALVAHYSSLAYINTQGNVIEKFKGEFSSDMIDSFDYSLKGEGGEEHKPDVPQPSYRDLGIELIDDNGYYGYRMSNGVVIPAQFDAAEPFKGEYAKAKYQSKYGVLKYVATPLTVTSDTKEIFVMTKESPALYKFSMLAPREFEASKLSVKFDAGSGFLEDITMSVDGGGNYSYQCKPQFTLGALELDTKIRVWYDGILIADVPRTIPITYPMDFTISGIQAVGSNADENDCQTVMAYVTNNTAIPVKAKIEITATSQNDSEGGLSKVSNPYVVTLNSGERMRISVDCSVYTRYNSIVEVAVYVDDERVGYSSIPVAMVPFYE